jgi:hypothetical protein
MHRGFDVDAIIIDKHASTRIETLINVRALVARRVHACKPLKCTGKQPKTIMWFLFV